MTDEVASPPVVHPGAGALREDPDFLRYAAARVTSLTGSAVTYLALPVLVYQLTRSSFWTALVVVAQGLPYLLLGLIAGAIADRIDRRRLMVWCDLVSAVVLSSVPAAYLFAELTVPHVLLVAFTAQSAFVFFDAANFGALPTLVGTDRLSAAQSTVYGGSTVVELVVPGLVGVALTVVSPAALLAVDAVSFVASALLVRAIARPLWDAGRAAADRHLVREIGDGLSFLWRHQVVRAQTLVGTVQSVAGGAFVGQLVPWSDQALDIPPGDGRLGLLFTAWAAGALVASLLVPRLARRYGEARVTLVALPVSAAGMSATVLAGHWLLALGCIAGWGVAHVIVVLNSVTLRQRVTPEHLLRRVNTGGRMLSYGAGWPVGAFLAGVVSEVTDPRTALVAVAGVLAVGAVVAWASPLLNE